MAPTLDQAECVDGALTEPTLTLPTTDGITTWRDPEGPYAPGDTVVVTATLDPTGVGWPATLPTGWIETSATTATYTVTFADVTCTPVTLVDPAVTFASCGADDVVPASVTLAETPGVTYTVTPPEPYDPFVETEVVVTATLDDGYAWADSAAAPAGFVARPQARAQALPPGWTETSPTTATFTILLPALPECPDGVTTTTAVTGGGGASSTTTTVPAALPRTGADGLGWTVGLAALLAGLGTAMLIAVRRRVT